MSWGCCHLFLNIYDWEVSSDTTNCSETFQCVTNNVCNYSITKLQQQITSKNCAWCMFYRAIKHFPERNVSNFAIDPNIKMSTLYCTKIMCRYRRYAMNRILIHINSPLRDWWITHACTGLLVQHRGQVNNADLCTNPHNAIFKVFLTYLNCYNSQNITVALRVPAWPRETSST